jgi:drug/metabolite transporter (DMT)-like permease
MKNTQIQNLFWFFLLACCWGPSFLFIKVAVENIPPLIIANLRVSIGAALLFLILKIRKTELPKFGPAWKHFAVMGLFSCALPFALFAISEQYIDSSLAAILNGTTPLFTLIIAHFFTENDRLTKTKLFGSLTGFFGLFVLVAPSLFEAEASTLGILVGTMAAASYGVGFVYAKKNIHGFKPLVVPTAQLFLASLFLLPFSLFVEDAVVIDSISFAEIASILGLAVFGTALAFVIYYKLIAVTSATYVAAVNYVLPVFGVVLGMAVLKECLTWNSYLGSVMILVGVMIINGVFSFSRKANS